MDINEVLRLERTIPSIRKIDQFLSKTDKYTTEYLKAFCYKMVIWGENNRINDALKEVYAYVPYFSEMIDEDVIIICDTIMHITLRARRLDEYQKYLQVKIGRLPTSRLKEKYLDSFYYYLALKDYNQARVSALEYAKFDNTKEESIRIQLELLSIAELLKDEETFNLTRDNLENLYKDSFDFEAISSFHLRVLRMLFILKNYSEAKAFAIDYLDDPHINKNQEIEAATIYLKILLLEHENKKATIFEAKYADVLASVSPEVGLEFAKTALSLYEAANHKISIDYYNELIEGFYKKLNTVKKEAKKKKEELVVIPDVLVEKPIIKNKDEKPGVDLIEVTRDTTLEVKVNPYLDDLMQGSNELLKYTKPLRDNIRDISLKMAEALDIKELDLLYFNKEYVLHKYKHERVYDKHYNELNASLQKQALEANDISFYSKDKLENYLDLFYQKPIDYEYAITMPLLDDTNKIGVLTIYSNTNMLENENLFMALYVFKNELNLMLLKEIERNNLYKENKYQKYIFGVTNMGYKYIDGNNLSLSPAGAYLLDLAIDSTLNDFYLGLNDKDKNNYANLLMSLKDSPRNNEVIYYDYKKNGLVKHYKETFFTYYNDELTILALFEDVTKEEEAKLKLKEKLFVDSKTELGNKNKLDKDILDYGDKFTLCLIGLNDFEKYKDIYGYEFYDAFIGSFSKALKDYFKNKYYVEIYLFNQGLFAIMLRSNDDKRLLQTRIKELLAYLEVSLSSLNYNIEPHYSMGVLRLDGKQSLDLTLVYDHLYDAYLVANEEYNGISNYSFFSYEAYKLHFKDRVIESNIALALDTNKIELSYQQIVDIENSEVYGYYAKLNIYNQVYKEEEIANVIRKKGLDNRLDKYKLMHVSEDLKKIYDSLKGYFEIFIEVSDLTIDANIKNFIKTQLSFFKIPANMINLIVDNYKPELDDLRNMNIGIITKNIYDIINHKTNRILLDYNKIKRSELKNLISFLKSYDALVILGGVNKASLEELKKEDVRYLFGDIYKKSYAMSELITKLKE